MEERDDENDSEEISFSVKITDFSNNQKVSRVRKVSESCVLEFSTNHTASMGQSPIFEGIARDNGCSILGCNVN